MTGTSESPVQSETATQPKSSQLNRVAAWVGIVAGVVFITAVIFFAGYSVGGHGFGGPHWNWRYHGNGSSQGGGCPMDSDDMMRPGMMGPGMMGPGQRPMPAAPSSPNPARP